MKVTAGKLALIIIAGIMGIVVLAIGALLLFFPADKIKTLVASEGSKVLGRTVTIDKVQFSLFPFIGATIKGLEVDGTTRGSFSNEKFVTLDKIQVQIALMSLFNKNPEITKIILDQPHILIEIDTAGHFSFDDLAVMQASDTPKKEKKEAGPLVLPVPVTLQKFAINNGVIIYRDMKSKQELSVNDLDQSIQFSIDKELKDIKTSGELILGSVSVKTKEIVKPLKDLKISLTHDMGADLVNGTATVNQLRLSFQKLFFNLKGNVTNLNATPVVDLNLESDPLQISDVLKEIPVELAPDVAKLTASGFAAVTLAIKGEVRDSVPLPINGTCKLDNVNVKYTELPKSINNLNALCDFTDTSVSISTMKFNLGDNPVELHASFINFKNPFVDLGILAKLNLADFRDIFVLPPGAELSGTANVDINAKGRPDPNDPSKLDLKGVVKFGDFSVLWPPLVKPAVIKGDVTLSSIAIGQNLDVTIGGSALKLNGNMKNYLSMVFPVKGKTLPRPYTEFTLAASMLNIDEFWPQSKDTVAATPSAAGSADTLLLPAPLPGIDMKAVIKSNKCIYQGIILDNLNMTVNVINDIADINVKTGFSGGTITNVLNGDLRDVNDIKFTNKFNVEKVQVAELISKFAPFIKPVNVLNREIVNLQNSLSGRLSLQSTFNGRGRSPDGIMKTLLGDLSIRVGDGQITKSNMVASLASKVEKFVDIKDIKFRDMKAAVHVENERLNFEDFKIGSSAGDWDIKGSTGFNGVLQMTVNNRLTKEYSDKVNALQNKGRDAAKNLLAGTKLSAASQLIDNVGIPADREGRITLKMNLGGTIDKPEASFAGFGEGVAPQADQKIPSQQVKQQAQQVIEEKKAELKATIDEEKIKAEEAARKKLEEEKAALEEQAKQKQEQLKNEGLKKLKKLF
ncbi:MAG: AsmA family protein [Fibrobacter sp.]|nr:AsmA family protein [Fibrobacter sp.]